LDWNWNRFLWPYSKTGSQMLSILQKLEKQKRLITMPVTILVTMLLTDLLPNMSEDVGIITAVNTSTEEVLFPHS